MDTFTVLGLVSFIPAVIILYFVLGEFEHYFKDNKAFFMIIVGLGLGMALGFTSLFFDLSDFLMILSVVALIEVVKFFILMQKPFRLNHDTTFYGLALGAGIGAMMVFVYSYAVGMAFLEEGTTLDLKTVLFVFLISYNYTFVNAGTGAIIGYGSYLGEFWKYLVRGFMVSGLHGLLMSLVWSFQFGRFGSFVVLGIGAIYCTGLIFYIYNEVIPASIPDEMRKRVEKLKEEDQKG
ncbi:MAG: hypothetical protein ACOC55_00315 [Candidatus Natronoplasma sp.]